MGAECDIHGCDLVGHEFSEGGLSCPECDLQGRIKEVEARADRYRAALAEIVALPRPQLQDRRTWREVALEALRDG